MVEESQVERGYFELEEKWLPVEVSNKVVDATAAAAAADADAAVLASFVVAVLDERDWIWWN